MQDHDIRFHRRCAAAGAPVVAALFLMAIGCDGSSDIDTTSTPGPGGQGGLSGPDDVREEISSLVSSGDVDLVAAIEAAEARAEGTAIEIQVSVRRNGGVFYDADVVAQDRVYDLELDVDTMDVLRMTSEPADGDDLADAALAENADWAAIIAAAEAEVGGNAFEIEVDDNRFDVEVLVDGTQVWDVVVNPDATIVRAQRDDDGEWADDQFDDS